MSDLPDLVTIPMPKGCVLVLTTAEYDRGIARGKALRRRQAFERRLQRLHEQRKQADAAREAEPAR